MIGRSLDGSVVDVLKIGEAALDGSIDCACFVAACDGRHRDEKQHKR